MSIIAEIEMFQEKIKAHIFEETSLKSDDDILSYIKQSDFACYFKNFERKNIDFDLMEEFKNSLLKIEEYDIKFENSELTKALKSLFSDKYYKFSEQNAISY